MAKTKVTIYANSIVVKSKNRKISITKHQRNRNCITLFLSSVNLDKGIKEEHAYQKRRLGANFTGMGLTFEALNDIVLAASLYHEHIEPIDKDSVFYSAD